MKTSPEWGSCAGVISCAYVLCFFLALQAGSATGFDVTVDAGPAHFAAY